MNFYKIIVISIIILQIINLNTSNRCGVNKFKIKPTIDKSNENDEIELRLLQQKSWEPIKIYVDYTIMDSQSKSVDQKQIDFAKRITNETVKIYENLLKIQKVGSKYMKISDACGPITLDSMGANLKTGSGVEADLIIFPIFDLEAEALTEAYASACRLHGQTNRPTLGVMGFNPKNFKIDMKNAFEYYTLLTVHEINHILSFNDTLFDYYTNPNTYKPLGRGNVVQKTKINGIERQIIITPKVREMAEKHFNCNSIAGIELENQGGEGSAGSHWESRVMLTDFMIAETYPENVISEISLALFEDSGWYKVNWYTGGLFRYGKNQGCDFVLKKCIINGDSKFPQTFCLASDKQMCFANNLSKGVCDLGIFQNALKSDYNYFPDNKKGGYNFADFCPVARWGSDMTNKMYFSNSCAIGLTNYKDLGETISEESSCFMSSLIPKNVKNFSSLKGKNRAICYETTCNREKKNYTVKILDTTITCPKEGGEISDPSMDGKFYCPDYNKICTKTSSCRDAIDCVKKKVQRENYNYDYEPKNMTILYNASPIGGSIIETNTNNNNKDSTPNPNKDTSFNGILVNYFIIVITLLNILF